MSYINLINYTNYSTGVMTPEEITDHPDSKEFGYASITDYCTLGGVPHFVKKCQEKNIKPIIGTTLSIQHNSSKGNIVFIAQNKEGYNELIRLISIQNEKKYIEINDLTEKTKNNTYSIIGQTGSILRYTEPRNTVTDLYNILGRKLILGVESGKEKEYFKNIYEIAKEKNLGVIMVNNNRAINKQTAVLINKKIENHEIYENSIIEEHEIDSKTNYFKSYQYYKKIGIKEEFLSRNQKIADIISDINIFNDVEMTNDKSNVDIEKLAKNNLEEFLENHNINNKETYRERLKEEFRIINETGYQSYFNIIYDIGSYAKNNNIAYGSRGSAVGSLVLFSLGLSHVDPIRHNLLFERFLNAERKELPDIDLEVGNQEPIINYLKEKYGEDHVSSVLSYTTLKKGKQTLKFAKDSLRETLKTEQSKIQLDETYNKIVSIGEKNGLYKGHSLLDNPLSEIITYENPILKLYKGDAKSRYLISLGLKSEGIIFNKTKKKDSFLIANKKIESYGSYIEDENKLKYLEASGKEYIQDLGLIKYDILPTNNLDLTLKLYNYLNIKGLNLYEEASYQDPETFKLISHGFTTNLNQLKSIGKTLCEKIKPQNIDELIAIMALVRLKKEDKEEYINAKFNKNKVNISKIKEYNKILEETYGVILYEEQIMLIAQNVGKLSKFESDEIRSSIKKGNLEKLTQYKEKFINNSISSGNNEEETKKIFKELEEKCGKYHFNKSHATAYAAVCYKQAYAKRHFPAEFLEFFGDKQTKKNKENTVEMLREFYKMGYKIATPDINRNEERKRTITIIDNNKEEEFIDYGLRDFIEDEKFINSLVSERNEDGYYLDVFDFIERTYPKYINENSILSPKAKNNPKEKDFKESLKEIIGYGFFDNLYNIKNEEINSFRNGLIQNIEEIFESALTITNEKDFKIKPNEQNLENIFIKEEQKFGISPTKLRVKN